MELSIVFILLTILQFGISTINVDWKPIGGNGTTNQWGNPFGKNVYPSSRWWTPSIVDSNGIAWIFGGINEAPIFGRRPPFYLGDLWTCTNGQWSLLTDPSYIINSPGDCWPFDEPFNFPSNILGASTWAVNGNFYLFGGRSAQYVPPRTTTGELADLWMFNGTYWTILSSSNGQTCVVNPVDSSTEYPSARFGSSTWSSNGELYFFGGLDQRGHNNDVWKYSKNQWISVSRGANSEGSYVDQGKSSTKSYPGARHAAASWYDVNGDMWIFGGVGQSGQPLSDLWKLDGDNQWTWVSGFYNNTTPVRPNYGVPSQFCNSNTPGSRQGSVAWADSKGRKWLFGGGLEGNYTYADLWLLNEKGQWAYITGSQVINSPGNYTSNYPYPGARKFATGWTDLSDQIWLFAGQTINGAMSDLWSASISGKTDGECTNPDVIIPFNH